jgi:hypothetical protein
MPVSTYKLYLPPTAPEHDQRTWEFPVTGRAGRYAADFTIEEVMAISRALKAIHPSGTVRLTCTDDPPHPTEVPL